MKTLPEILETYRGALIGILLEGYENAVEGRKLMDSKQAAAAKAIAKELMGCLGEEELEDVDDYPFEYGKQVGRNEKLLEVRARLTAFIGHKEK